MRASLPAFITHLRVGQILRVFWGEVPFRPVLSAPEGRLGRPYTLASCLECATYPLSHRLAQLSGLARTAEENPTLEPKALFGTDRRRRGSATANHLPSPYREGTETEQDHNKGHNGP